MTEPRPNMYTGSENQPVHNASLSSSIARHHTIPAQPAHQLQDLQRILASATHFALMASGNEAHTGLYTDSLRMKYQIEAQTERIAELKEELKEARDSIKSFSKLRECDDDSKDRQPKRVTPEQDTIRIPEAPLDEDEDDFPEVRFWKRQEWTEYESRASMRNEKVHKLGFVCDESGKTVPNSRLAEMTEAAKIAWNKLYHYRLDPATWSKRIDKAMRYFSSTMRAKFPEFRYCEGGWKLQEFAKTRYPDWSCNTRQTGKLSRANPSIGKRKAENTGDAAPKTKKKQRSNAPAPDHAVIDLDSEGEVTSAPSSNNIGPPATATAAGPVASSSRGFEQARHPLNNVGVSVTSLSPPEEPSSDPSITISTPTAIEHPPRMTPSVPSPEAPSTNALAVATVESTTGSQLVLIGGDASATVPSSIAAREGVIQPVAVGVAQRASLPMPGTSQGTEALQVASVQPVRRVKLNPLAGLSIPKPPSEVAEPQSGTPSLSTAAALNPKKGKLIEASGTLLTARNLYLIDYLTTHQDEHPTVVEFRDIYKQLDPAVIKKYEEISKERKAAAAKIAPPSQDNS